jgi:hypothetical protein
LTAGDRIFAGEDLLPSGIRDHQKWSPRAPNHRSAHRESKKRRNADERHLARARDTFGEAHSNAQSCKRTRSHADHHLGEIEQANLGLGTQ